MSEALKNDTFLRALNRQPVDRLPVWLMRQAGRYLPEYRQIRSQAGDFMSLCRNPALACEVTMQPLRRFELDAAILFSDILTIPDALGLGLYFEQGEGPRFRHPLRCLKEINSLPEINVRRDLDYVLSAVEEILGALQNSVPLIGFSGSPWTLACYMVQGQGSKDFSAIKRLLYSEPATVHVLLEKLTDAVTHYLAEQIRCGVHAVQIFDTWGGLLTPSAYSEFSLFYMQQVIERLHDFPDIDSRFPIILFTKNGGQWLESMAATGAAGLGLDWTVDAGEAREKVRGKVALQGNLDPAVLLGSAECVRDEAKRVIDAFGTQPGHIFNLGHGVTPEVPPENVKVLVDCVHQYSRECYSS